jgi:hypothetical protein
MFCTVCCGGSYINRYSGFSTQGLCVLCICELQVVDYTNHDCGSTDIVHILMIKSILQEIVVTGRRKLHPFCCLHPHHNQRCGNQHVITFPKPVQYFEKYICEIFALKTTSHKSNPSSAPQGYVDSYTTLPWVTWEVVTGVEGLPC